MFGIKTDMFMSLLRHLLTTFGGVLVSSGYISQNNLEAGIGAIIVLVGLGFAGINHTLANSSANADNAAKTVDPRELA